MRTGEIIGVEALIRWQHPERGLLLPADFLPVIEGHPLSIDVGEWVIDTALTQLEQWHAAGIEMQISVNVSAFQLQQTNFTERLHQMLAAHPNVLPASLEIEVLETSALEDVIQTSKVIEICRKVGILFALDDFGTGYSSLTYLKRLPVNLLKIDQSFVRDMLDDPDDMSILEGVLDLGMAFRRKVIAEGVETVEHGRILLQMGCDLAQGYGIARPMPAQEMPRWAATWHPDPIWLNLPSFSRDDLPVLFAGVEHRAWVMGIKSFLEGKSEVLPQIAHHQCRFGEWLKGSGFARYGVHSAYPVIEALHRRVHELATELLALHTHGRNAEALARLDELDNLRDALLAQLKTLV
jgi:EAL domain-containing protein (putative c-di-GMP-specific phosphodiesterase class I)